MRVLIFGLPGSGKTILANTLNETFEVQGLNGDDTRRHFDDWDFSYAGRIRQARRLSTISYDKTIIDFVAPLQEMRDTINPTFTIWMNTVQSSQYPDTDAMFEPPLITDITITSFDYDINDIITQIRNRYNEN